MTIDQDNLIVDRYKGMEIVIRAQLGECNTWRYYIQICAVSRSTRKRLLSTVRSTTGRLPRSAAMARAFTEALQLCDSVLESESIHGEMV